MRLPRLNAGDISHNPTELIEFRGLNLLNTATPGEYSDTVGLSSEGYPYLTQIPERTVDEGYKVPRDIFVWDHHLYVVDNGYLRKDGESIGFLSNGQKQTAIVNTKLVIMPDKVYLDLTDDTIHELQPSWVPDQEHPGVVVTWGLGDNDTVAAYGIDEQFTSGDVIDVIGQTDYKKLTVLGTETNTLLLAPGALGKEGSGQDLMGTHVVPSFPDLDYICSSNNRLWGVCNDDNTIYVSALGDPTDFFRYTNDLGPFSVAVGSEGDFSAICAYNGSVLAWKEEILHKILGSYPSEYYMIDSPTYGVQIGSSRSLVIINNVLYYKGIFGVYQYAGNAPVLISSKLGLGIYTEGVATTDGRKYYIGMLDADGNGHLYAYDLQHGLWMKEEDEHVVAMAHDTRFVSYIKHNEDIGETNPGQNLMLNTFFPVQGLPSTRVKMRDQSGDTYVGNNSYSPAQHGLRVSVTDPTLGVPYLRFGAIASSELNGLVPGQQYVLSFGLEYRLISAVFNPLVIELTGEKFCARLHAYYGGEWHISAGSKITFDRFNWTGSRFFGLRFTVPANAKGAYITVGCEDCTTDEFSVNDYFELTNVKLEIGDTPTTWTPAAEDQEYKLLHIGTSLDNRHWSCELAEITEDPGRNMRRKGYLKLIFRLDMSAGSALKVYAKEDRRDYRLLYEQEETNAVTLLVPIRLGRCDRWQLKLEGVGEVTIRGIEREYVLGSAR